MPSSATIAPSPTRCRPFCPSVRSVGELLIEAYQRTGILYTFGNGGSAADAQHFTGEIIGHYKRDRRPLPAVTLSTDPTTMTCIANDYSYDDVFSRQVQALARPGDVVAAFTTSGRSANIVGALRAAKEKGATTVLFGGGDGGPSKEFADVALLVPSIARRRASRRCTPSCCTRSPRWSTRGPTRTRSTRERRAERPVPPTANAPSGPQPRDLAAAPRPAASPDRTIHMIGNAHLDPVWLWPWQEGYQEARATFWSAIHRMDEYPDFVFTCDQIVLLSWVEESGPRAVRAHPRARRRGALGQRRRMVGRAGLQHADGGVLRPPGAVRPALPAVPLRPDGATVGMNVDPFGHNVMIPQILRRQRMDSYMLPAARVRTRATSTTRCSGGSRPTARGCSAYRIPFEYGSPPGDIVGPDREVARAARPQRSAR